ncbi:hypothetical protein B0I33_109264 [Prauserella shujinwangii]|uniref:Uncharacterized protein n=1 Tax=Prauserella shujinwangii TaxID=1453103 RepID=A0A2T0LQJ5_9PSEU|nr:LapA family protein [Prauserella shujinwangii]PRX45601.1 hypothetical protein B0I33_109264 [Prauserella shujinwangii]
MSLFGQVWVFSAAAFVLGALLAWLFLVRPAQRRIRELERALAAYETSAAPTAHQGASSRSAADWDDEEPVAAVPPTRTFVPAEEQPEEPAPREPTERLAPAPHWLEQDSLQGYRSEHPEHSGDERAEDDRWDHEPGAAELTSVLDPASGDYTGRYPGDRPEDHPRDDEYGRYAEHYADEPEPERQPRPGSLFEPAYEPVEEDEPDQRATTAQPPAYAFGDPEADPADEPVVEQTHVLPKRQPRQALRGGFEPPKPIQPSMRAVTRREPEDAGVQSGSLFEPAVTANTGGRDSGADTPPAREPGGYDDGLPPGPFGPGSAMPLPGGAPPSAEYTVKASVTALRYCTEESDQFPNMVAEVWFRTPADAERVGFRPLA